MKIKMKWLKVTVFCHIFCVLKCFAMSTSEIEEFSNFLKRTSQLDEILKKGSSPDEEDEDEIISDHAWEESGKFEGDLVLNDRQRRVIVEDVAEGLSRNGLRDSTKRWPDNEVVYYIQREHFTGDQLQAIKDGIDDIAQASCVKFRPYRKGDRDAVVIQGSRRGCFSQVGYQGGYQVLNLSGRHPVGKGCFRHGTVVHELLHTLGFYHMQSSPDRDDYIDVKWENIVEPAKHNFRKYNLFSVSDFGVGYDYDSVLHYSRRAFSKNGQDTLVPKQSGASIGQRVGLSDKDSQKLNKMYCDAESDNNDASEETTHKTITKKKAPKNKPFEGHGIGYHQGKTVVIKLPAAETIKLHDTPTFHVFDHFSKTPQTVSPAVTQGFGAGEEITYEYRPIPFNPKDYERSSFANTEDKPNDRAEIPKYEYSIYKQVLPSAKPDIQKVEQQPDKSSSNNPGLEVSNNGSSVKVSDDIDAAFERLGHIIRSHVYPSQKPNLDVYKTKDYSIYYTPKPYHEPEPEIVKVDKKFASTLFGNTHNVNQHQTNEQKSETENNKQKHDDVEIIGSPYKDDRLTKEYDNSYGTAYPLNLLPKVNDKPFVTPTYARLENLANKHNYSGLYRPLDSDEQQNEKPTIFSYVLPIHDAHHNNEEFKKDNLKYDQDSYTYPYGYEHSPSKLVKLEPQYKGESNFGRLPSEKQAYSLFGVLVPLTQKWYKVDYEPYKGPYTIGSSESNEDYR